jgi:hypothetical protein
MELPNKAVYNLPIIIILICTLKKTLNLEKTIVRYVLGRSKRLETNTVPFILATFGAAVA